MALDNAAYLYSTKCMLSPPPRQLLLLIPHHRNNIFCLFVVACDDDVVMCSSREKEVKKLYCTAHNIHTNTYKTLTSSALF